MLRGGGGGLLGSGAVGTLATGAILGSAGGPAGALLGAAAAGVTASISKAVDVGSDALGAGIVNSSRGGTFSGGVQRSLLSAANSALPLGLNEALGFGRATRTLEGAEGDLNSITNPIARVAGANAISPTTRAFLADVQIEQNRNLQADRDANAALVSDKTAQAVDPGSAAQGLVRAIQTVTRALETLAGASSSQAG